MDLTRRSRDEFDLDVSGQTTSRLDRLCESEEVRASSRFPSLVVMYLGHGDPPRRLACLRHFSAEFLLPDQRSINPLFV